MKNSFFLMLLIASLGFCSSSRTVEHYFHSQIVLATSSKERPEETGLPESGDEICYGVFLNENAILTAASCLHRDERSVARLGFKPFDENKIYWQLPPAIADLSVHPTADLAVLRLTPIVSSVANGSLDKLDSIRRRIVLPCVDYSPPPPPTENSTLQVLSFGNISPGELNPLYIRAFREGACDDRQEACVRSATDQDSTLCFGDNGVGLLTVEKALIGIGKQFPSRRIAEANRRNCEAGIEKYTLLAGHREFIDRHAGNYCSVDNLDNRRNSFFLY